MMCWDTVYKRAMDVCSDCIENYLTWREVTCMCMFLITVICMEVWVCVQHLCVCFAAAASCRHCFSIFIFPRSVSHSHISSWLGQRGGVILFKPDRETWEEGRARKEDLKMTRWETLVQFFSYLFHDYLFFGTPPHVFRLLTEWKWCDNEVWGLRM